MRGLPHQQIIAVAPCAGCTLPTVAAHIKAAIRERQFS
jgi:hypothetical protein